MVKFSKPVVACTNPLGLKFSVVSALNVTGQLENGTAAPTFEYKTAGGWIF
jgi:hypothetical protein